MSGVMRCFESLLTNIENDRQRFFTPEASARTCIQTRFLQHEPEAVYSGPKSISSIYQIDKHFEARINNEIPVKLPVTLKQIQKAVDDAARTRDAVIHLGRLRRQLAWSLHPDRHIDHATAVLLAEANACIDRALTQVKV
jgi:hypothetical protein